MLIIVDGPDGSGKSWLINDLVKKLDIIKLELPTPAEYSSDEERVVCQQVGTKIALDVAKLPQKFVADRLILSNLVYNDAAKRSDGFDYLKAIKDNKNVIMIRAPQVFYSGEGVGCAETVLGGTGYRSIHAGGAGFVRSRIIAETADEVIDAGTAQKYVIPSISDQGIAIV